MAFALVASVTLHAVLLSTQLVKVNPRLFEDYNQPVEVVLVNAKSKVAPLKPDALAQANLAGGGNTDEDRRARSPLPVTPDEGTGAQEAALQARVERLEERAKQLFTQIKSTEAVQTAPRSAPPQEPAEATPTSSELLQQGAEMAKLEARISRQWDEYQRRPRRAFIGANTREYAFARYVEDWAAKVERIGNLNYPEAARRQGIYGSLRLTVSLYSDGRVEKIAIDQSSGSKILDSAAVRIVEMGAPYAHFPKEMRDKVDILGITRTWTFTRSDQLGTVGAD
ncbi:MAG TPA: TonB family protein [Thiobacillaceae bacterium]|nr:TonB family protein [Thiobacillaceae bacterium]